MTEDPEPSSSNSLQRHVPEEVGHTILPVGNSSRHRDASELLAHHFSYKMQRTKIISKEENVNLPFTRRISSMVELS